MADRPPVEVFEDAAAGIVEVRVRGGLTAELLEKAVGSLLDDEGKFKANRRIWDFRETENELAAELVRQLSGVARSRDAGPSRVAIVTDNDAVFGMSRMWVTHRETPEVAGNVFRDINEARDWIRRPMPARSKKGE